MRWVVQLFFPRVEDSGFLALWKVMVLDVGAHVVTLDAAEALSGS